MSYLVNDEILIMRPTKKSARIAGFLYLIVVISGIVSLMYVPSKLIVWDNAIETYNNIVANESLFKMGILSSLIMYTTFIFLSIALYKLLMGTSRILLLL